MSNNEGQELKIYELTNKTNGEKSYQAATTAEDACKQAGWMIGDCFVNTQTWTHHHTAKAGSQLLYKIPCQVCPFQYAECLRPADNECPARPNAPELNEWLKQAAEAHLCDYYGQELSEKDYQLTQKWIPLAQAIAELESHH